MSVPVLGARGLVGQLVNARSLGCDISDEEPWATDHDLPRIRGGASPETEGPRHGDFGIDQPGMQLANRIAPADVVRVGDVSEAQIQGPAGSVGGNRGFPVRGAPCQGETPSLQRKNRGIRENEQQSTGGRAVCIARNSDVSSMERAEPRPATHAMIADPSSADPPRTASGQLPVGGAARSPRALPGRTGRQRAIDSTASIRCRDTRPRPPQHT